MEKIILSNSKKMFYEAGYFKTDISNITKKCGISADKFYMYYESKEDLLAQVIKEDLEVFREEVQTFVPKVGEGSLKMSMFIRALLKLLKNNPFFFTLLMELEENEKELSSFTNGWLKQFWKEVRTFIEELLESEDTLDQSRLELLTTLVENQLKIYIRHLLTDDKDRIDPAKLLFLNLERDISRLSTMTINTCRLFHIFSTKEDHSSAEVYKNKEFFKLFEKVRSDGKPLYLIFLDFNDLSTTEDLKKNYLKNSILTNIGFFLTKYFRRNDIVGRLCPPKFMILVRYENFITDTLNSRMDKLIRDLKNEYSLTSTDNIKWKVLHLNSLEDFPQKLTHLKPLKEKNIG